MKKRIFVTVLTVALMFSFFSLFAVNASAASEMKASDACIQMIQGSEGFRAIPYWDYSQWTVGFGTACPEEDLDRYKKEGIPVEEAQALFVQQLARFETAVNKFIDKHGLTLSQQQFDALVSFTYNLGSGSLNKTSYTIVQAVLNGATENEMIYAFSIYCMAGGEFQPGLMRRRMAEANLFLNGVYSEYAPESFCYVHYDANGGVRDASAQGYDSNLAAVPMSRPSKEGYTFVGWYTKAEGGVKVTSLDETHNGMTLYAHWEEGVTEVETPSVPAEGVNVTVLGSTLHVRSGPGQNYGITADVYAGEILTITGTTEANGLLWGKCSAGWICLDHTNYFDIFAPEVQEPEDQKPAQLPVYATVVSTDSVTVYNGPHTTYPKLRTLSEGKVILVEEYTNFAGQEWVRYEGGWIRLSSKLLIHDEHKLAHNFTMTPTDTLVVRGEPSADSSKVTTLSKGTAATVYAVACVDGVYWGRVAKGWVNLTYSDFDQTLLAQYQSHSFGQWYNHTPSTCITRGTDRRDCQYCDEYETREAVLGDHSFGSWQVTQQPTCTAQGQEQRSCTLCDAAETRAVSATGHSMTDWAVVQEATCVEAGQEQRKCTACDHSETRAISASGHSMTDWAVLQEATCVDAGQEQRKCETCGHSETREIAPLGHSFGAWYEIKAPTAEEAGEERRDCTVCGHSETRQQAPTEHTFGEWYVTQEATCTQTGLQRRDCKTCDHYEEREVEALSHSLGQWYAATLPTCTAPGEERRDCQRCEHYESRTLEALGHSLGQWYVAAPPSCTEPGEERRDCQRCDHYESRALDATGHSFGDWYESIAPTTEEYGQERRDCTGCGHYETRQTDKLPIPTVTRIYATITCDALRIRSGPGTGYKQVGRYFRGTEVEILEIRTEGGKEWGRTEDGWICMTGYVSLRYVEEGPHTTHTYGDWYVAQAATCTADGLRRRDCTVCEHHETETIAATGHSFGDWYESIAPTTTSYGQERRDCANCNHNETRETPMLEVELVTKVYATITCDYLSIRAGAGSGYKRIGKIYHGARVEILEQVTKNGVLWGRTTTGWIWLTGYATLETVTEEAPAEQPVLMMVTADSLTVRVAPGTSNKACGYLYTGAQVLVFETKTVNGALWARTDFGWVMAKYLE